MVFLAPDTVPGRLVLAVRVAAAVMAALFGLSRMCAGVHRFSDVHGGALWASMLWASMLWASMLLATLLAFRPALGELCDRAAATWRVRTAQHSSSR